MRVLHVSCCVPSASLVSSEAGKEHRLVAALRFSGIEEDLGRLGVCDPQKILQTPAVASNPFLDRLLHCLQEPKSLRAKEHAVPAFEAAGRFIEAVRMLPDSPRAQKRFSLPGNICQ